MKIGIVQMICILNLRGVISNMLFHFEMSSNDVRRNSDFIFILSSAYNTTSKAVQEENFRRSVGFFLARLMVDPRKKANWHLSDNLHIAPMVEE